METAQPKVVIIIPTYNELESIRILLDNLQKIIRQHPEYGWNILVVDRFSPDGTGDHVRSVKNNFPNVEVIDRLKQGIGTAYQAGFEWVEKNMPSADFIIQMDGDLSHDPQKIISFLETAKNGFDVVVGSRYVPGGEWTDAPLVRNIISRCGNASVRVLGNIKSIHDCTSGYKCIRKNYIEKIASSGNFFSGHAFQIQFIESLLSSGARIAEIPIKFQTRKYGSSKLRLRDFHESAAAVFGLWKKRSRKL